MCTNRGGAIGRSRGQSWSTGRAAPVGESKVLGMPEEKGELAGGRARGSRRSSGKRKRNGKEEEEEEEEWEGG